MMCNQCGRSDKAEIIRDKLHWPNISSIGSRMPPPSRLRFAACSKKRRLRDQNSGRRCDPVMTFFLPMWRENAFATTKVK
jgi:hypothetical protein